MGRLRNRRVRTASGRRALLVAVLGLAMILGAAPARAAQPLAPQPLAAPAQASPLVAPAQAAVQPAAVAPQPDGPTAGPLSAGVPVSVNTGEKPQSKVWFHDGSWWAVMASTSVSPSGTWLWRSHAGSWTNMLRLSGDATLRADAKQMGDVVHVLLHGPSPMLVSVEYDAARGTYRPWSQRPAVTPVDLPGSETATIDIDSTGRMWLASDAPPNVEVRYADAPYQAFSGPIVLASNILLDDITVVTALPNGSVGVMWSNQSTERFGFRTHRDGTAPQTWTADEVPAGGSALRVGDGMADDHLNLAVASDGTLYAAVKTSYESDRYPVIALLVRRPDGSWDPLRQVDNIGTRPIVLLDEETQMLTVLYTQTTNWNNILMKSTPTAVLDFSRAPATAMAGRFNDVTSTKENWSKQVLVLASTVTEAFSTVLSAPTGPSPAAGPVVAAGSVSTTEGQSVSGVLKVVSSSGGPLVFEVVDRPARGSVVLTDAASGKFTYTPAPGVLGADAFSFRVRDGELWSDAAVVDVSIGTATGLRGQWSMDEGRGSVVGDGSGWGGAGSTVGAVSWGPGVAGSAVVLDGAGGYVSVPHAAGLNVAGAMTVAAWVRPEKVATQYLVKKAVVGSRDGFELGLSSTGKAFFRLNEASSADRYRVNATSVQPADGRTWVHLAGTYDGTRMRIFVDGVEQASVAGPAAVGVNNLALGLGAEPGGRAPFRGGLDEVRLYDRALGAEDIARLAARGGGSVPAPVVAAGSVSTTEGQSVSGVLKVVSSSGGPLVFEVVDRPARGSVVLTDAASGKFTYTPAPGVLGADAFSFRVRDGELWSDAAVVDVSIGTATGLRGQWSMDEGRGSVVGDGSGWGGAGSTVGAVSWGPGVAGSAVVLDGAGGYVSVPHAAGLNVAGAMTVAAWVRPEKVATQYLVKKAVVGSRDGFELGLSSTGKAFFRLNEASSADRYRVNATSVQPADGRTWVHLAGTYDGTRMRIFVDGVEQASVAGPAAVGVNNLALGLGAEPGGRAPFRGGLDEVRLYDRALGAEDIARLA
ncbi:LamG-like jellyroll fold domain-containing protein, partial [Georgenia thermotolerans]|uniref:LamG-like jellyroll fold domain-containing protein n=1 Tax=Georgenia thermotolerans TaxID=527326 RepID=UPI00126508EB